MKEAEVWRPVVGWDGYYEVSSLGRVRLSVYRHPEAASTKLHLPALSSGISDSCDPSLIGKLVLRHFP
jgi:hypothetical protein